MLGFSQPEHRKQEAIDHHRGCHTARCDRHADREWAERHRPRLPAISTFDLCVANRENGEPGSTSYGSIDWFAVNGYYGAYSFLHSTWESMGGERYAYNANEASPAEQSAIFNYGARTDPGAWPNTIPPCLGA